MSTKINMVLHSWRKSEHTTRKHRKRCWRLPEWQQRSPAKAAGDSSRHLTALTHWRGVLLAGSSNQRPHWGVDYQTPMAIAHCPGFRWALVVQPVWDSMEVKCASQKEYVKDIMGRSAMWKAFLFCIYGGSSISLDPLHYNLLLAINSGIEFQDAYSILTTIIF